MPKNGACTWIIDQGLFYSGATTVSAGTLAVNGVLTGEGSISVASGATLAGTGSVAGAVQVQAGGTFAPANWVWVG